MKTDEDEKDESRKHRKKTRDGRRLTLKIEAPLSVDVVVGVVVKQIVAVDAPLLAASQLPRGHVFRAAVGRHAPLPRGNVFRAAVGRHVPLPLGNVFRAAVGRHVPLPGHSRHTDEALFSRGIDGG